MDISTIKPWDILAAKSKRGKTIQKSEVIELLKSKVPLTDDAFDLMIKIVSGDARYGSRPEKYKSWVIRHQIAIDTLVEEERFSGEKLRGESARDKAKDLTSKAYGVSKREVEKCLKEFKEIGIDLATGELKHDLEQLIRSHVREISQK